MIKDSLYFIQPFLKLTLIQCSRLPQEERSISRTGNLQFCGTVKFTLCQNYRYFARGSSKQSDCGRWTTAVVWSSGNLGELPARDRLRTVSLCRTLAGSC
jgi:hypothetical protein